MTSFLAEALAARRQDQAEQGEDEGRSWFAAALARRATPEHDEEST